MKKTYVKPSLVEVKIGVCNLMAGSSVEAGGDTPDNLAPRGVFYDDIE